MSPLETPLAQRYREADRQRAKARSLGGRVPPETARRIGYDAAIATSRQYCLDKLSESLSEPTAPVSPHRCHPTLSIAEELPGNIDVQPTRRPAISQAGEQTPGFRRVNAKAGMTGLRQVRASAYA